MNDRSRYRCRWRRWLANGVCGVLLSAMGTVVIDGNIYVCGGYDGKSSLNSVESYSPETDR